MDDIKPQAQHTQGPWQVRDDHPARSCLSIEGPDCAPIATLYWARDDGMYVDADGVVRNDLVRQANAHLLGAAEVLLKAAQAAEAILARQNWLDTSTAPEALALRQLRAAIAQATGATATSSPE